MHQKTGVFYKLKADNSGDFVRVDEDDRILQELKRNEDMSKAMKSANFVAFDKDDNVESNPTEAERSKRDSVASINSDFGNNGAANTDNKDGTASAGGKSTVGQPTKCIGIVTSWNAEKGFGFIQPTNTFEDKTANGSSIFVHRKNIVGYSTSNPSMNLEDQRKVSYRAGNEAGKPCALEVMMLDEMGQPLAIHKESLNKQDKRAKYFVTSQSLRKNVFYDSCFESLSCL